MINFEWTSQSRSDLSTSKKRKSGHFGAGVPHLLVVVRTLSAWLAARLLKTM
jgi:hypothetical protein